MSLAALTSGMDTLFTAFITGNMHRPGNYYRKNGTATVDPDSGVVTDPETMTAVNYLVDSSNKFNLDSDSIQRGDIFIFVRQNELSFEPHVEDEVQYEGKRWSVVAYDDYLDIVYRLQIRSLNK